MENNDPRLTRLDCRRANLDDEAINRILNVYLDTPGVSPLGELNLWNNHLTRVPDHLYYFSQLNSIDLDNNNISSIDPRIFTSNLIPNF